ncbi:MAG: hypothetical protein ACJ75T_11500 [Solirubrobacterales bacterium]
MHRLQKLSPRQRYGTAGLIVFIGLSAWASLERDLFEGLILLGTLGAIGLAALNHFLPPRPRFQVSFRNVPDPGVLSLVPDWRKRPLDQAAIAQEQVDLALETMPQRPHQAVPPHMQIGRLIAEGAIASFQSAIAGTTEEELQDFENKVAAYGGEVADWVGRFEASREEHLKVFKGKLRVEELGSAPADHVRLRLRFPKGFRLTDDLSLVGKPPARPKFNPSVFDGMGNPIRKAQRAGSIPWPLSDNDEPTYSMEHGEPVVECDLGRINQGDHRDAPVIELRIPGPGSFVVQWEASSSGLGKPAIGTLTIVCEAAKEGPPITTLKQAEDQWERIGRL